MSTAPVLDRELTKKSKTSAEAADDPAHEPYDQRAGGPSLSTPRREPPVPSLEHASNSGGHFTSRAAASDLIELCRAGLAEGGASYERVRRAAADPASGFWETWAARELHWFHAERGAWLSQEPDGSWSGWSLDGSLATLDAWQPWEAAVDASEAPHVRWFCGAMTNAAFNEVDRHVLRGHGSEVAFIADSPDGEAHRVTRRWLLLHSVLAAHALRDGLRVAAPQRIALRAGPVKKAPHPGRRPRLGTRACT